MNYVLIGNSAAAVGCVEGIRSVDPSGKITLVSKEPFHTYSRPLISYLLEGKTDLERMKYRPDSFYEKMNCRAVLGEEAVKVLPEEKRVILSGGEELPFDRLLLATGSSPFVPPIPGLEQVPEKFTFLSLEDALALQKAIKKESRVLILGAGLIGLKCAEGILESAAGVQVVDLADRVLPSILEGEAANRVQEHLMKRGVSFFLGDTVERFEPYAAHLKSGREIPFDILVIAVGVRPNLSLGKEAGCLCGKGICTNEKGETSVPSLYAAGDCCESLDITSGERKVLALLPNAYLQGECAGKNMAGGCASFENAVPMNAIGFLGLHLITAGSYRGEKQVLSDENSYRAFFTENGLLKGFILLGDCLENAGIYTGLIRERTPLSTVDFELLKRQSGFLAFSPGKRRELFGQRKGERHE